MCILFISRKKNSNWPILIATNRDEFYNREFDFSRIALEKTLIYMQEEIKKLEDHG